VRHRAIYRSFTSKATLKFAKRISSETSETGVTRIFTIPHYRYIERWCVSIDLCVKLPTSALESVVKSEPELANIPAILL